MPPRPQTEDGYTRIANELMEALLRHPFTHRQLRVMLGLMRKTYGWHRKADVVSASQLADLTGLKRQHVMSTMRDLEAMNAIHREPVGRGFRVGIQKDYSRWTDPKTGSSSDPKSGSEVIPKRDQYWSQNGIKSDPKLGPTKERKEIRRSIPPPSELNEEIEPLDRDSAGWLEKVRQMYGDESTDFAVLEAEARCRNPLGFRTYVLRTAERHSRETHERNRFINESPGQRQRRLANELIARIDAGEDVSQVPNQGMGADVVPICRKVDRAPW